MGARGVDEVKGLLTSLSDAVKADDLDEAEALIARLETEVSRLSPEERAQMNQVRDDYRRLCLMIADRRDDLARELSGISRSRKAVRVYRGALPTKPKRLNRQA